MTSSGPVQRVKWEILTDLPDDRETIEAWDQLVAMQPCPMVFLTHAWLDCWWRYYGTGRKMVLVAGRREGRAVALAPLMISPKPFYLWRASRVRAVNTVDQSVH